MVQVIEVHFVEPQSPGSAPRRVSLVQDGGLQLPQVALAHNKQKSLPTRKGLV